LILKDLISGGASFLKGSHLKFFFHSLVPYFGLFRAQTLDFPCVAELSARFTREDLKPHHGEYASVVERRAPLGCAGDVTGLAPLQKMAA